MKSSMPPQAEILTITVDDFCAQQAEEVANDVFLQAEQILRSLGDTGGGRALARLVKALHGEGGLKFNDLLPLDSGNRSIALALIKEFLDECRSFDEWESLAELADRCVFHGE